jgi:hypothetical protein
LQITLEVYSRKYEQEEEFIDFINDQKKQPRTDILLPDAEYYEALVKRRRKSSQSQQEEGRKTGNFLTGVLH